MSFLKIKRKAVLIVAFCLFALQQIAMHYRHTRSHTKEITDVYGNDTLGSCEINQLEKQGQYSVKENEIFFESDSDAERLRNLIEKTSDLDQEKKGLDVFILKHNRKVLARLRGESSTEESTRGDDAFLAFNEADGCMEVLGEEIKWFLDHCSPKQKPVLSKSEIQENGYAQKWQDEHDRLIEAVQDVQKEFFLFREKMMDVMSARFDQGRYGASMRAQIALDLTKWYAGYIENNLFPFEWRALYKKRLEEKN